MPSAFPYRLSVIILTIAVIAGGFVTSASPTRAAGPDLRLRPDDGVPGASVVARGRGFDAASEGIVLWGDDDDPELASFTTDAGGDFEVTITVPDVPPGDYRVRAVAGDQEADDRFAVGADDASQSGTAPPATPPVSPATGGDDPCAGEAIREVPVANAAELTEALAGARAGDRIMLAEARYVGNFVAEVSGTADGRMLLCGSRGAVLDGGGWEHSGYALHVTGSFWTVSGITVTNAQKGVMLDGAQSVVLDRLDVHAIGHEAVHFRDFSSDNVIEDSDIHDTGLDNEKFGEGIYFGTAVSNWETISDGEPDRSDRNRALRNRIWNTSSESIDLKEGTSGGLVEGNIFDGATMRGADSWVDVKGTGYVIRGNTGTNAPEDGFQTHVIDDMGYGRDNVFEGNVATVNGPGYGFYIHNPDDAPNIVRCDNVVEAADSGVSNLENLDGRCGD